MLKIKKKELKRSWNLEKGEKVYFTLIFSIMFLSMTIPLLANFTQGFFIDVTTFEVDKESYYYDEDIFINATWDLTYNPRTEINYIQIQIYDMFGDIIWNSPQYDDIGIFSNNWTISIQNLDFPFLNSSNYFSIRMFYYYLEIATMNKATSFLETIQVQILKKEPTCQLIGFNSYITYNETLDFKAKFFINSTNLANEDISFKVDFNSSIIYEANFTTDINGEINLTISSDQLEVGENILIFEILNNVIYNNTIFQFNITLGKIHIYSEIIDFKDVLNQGADLEAEVQYYYYFNNTRYNLNYYPIIIKIFDNNTLLYSNVFTTDEAGALEIEIPQLDFDIDQGTVNVHLISQETEKYESDFIILVVRIVKPQGIDPETQNYLPFAVIGTLGVIVGIIGYFGVKGYLKKNKPQDSSELSTSLD